jgi:hypothetical protein
MEGWALAWLDLDVFPGANLNQLIVPGPESGEEVELDVERMRAG